MTDQDVYRRLLEHVRESVMVAVADGSLVFANNAASKMLGYPIEQILTMNIAELPTVEEADKIRQRAVDRIQGKDVPNTYETTLRHSDGTTHYVHVTASRTVWHDQPASVAIVRDVSREKVTADALRRSEELLRTVLDNTPAFVFSYDIDENGERHSTYIGVGLKDLLGPASAEAIGQSIRRFIERIHPDDFRRLEAAGVFDTASLEPVDLEYRVLGDHDQYRWVHNTMRAELLSGGRIRWYGTMRDITDRRRTAEELARLRRIESIGIMAGGIAHEVHNALYPARISLRLLAEERESGATLGPDKQAQLMERCERAVERAVRVTDAIRQFARAVPNTEIEQLPLRSFVEDVWGETYDPEEAPVALVNEIATDLAIALNREHAHSVLANIFSNAIDAMHDSAERTIAVRAERTREKVKLQISDTGEGIAEGMQERLFEPFVSSKPRTGTGVGLAICQRILELYGGTIALEPLAAGGACVTIMLPVQTQRA